MGWKIFHLPLCVGSYDNNVLDWLDQVSGTPYLMFCPTLSSYSWGWIVSWPISYSSSVSKRFPVCRETSALVSHFPEHVQGCVDQSLLVTSASRAEAVIVLCNAESLML